MKSTEAYKKGVSDGMSIGYQKAVQDMYRKYKLSKNGLDKQDTIVYSSQGGAK